MEILKHAKERMKGAGEFGNKRREEFYMMEEKKKVLEYGHK
jgi:hypothetical protein